jgi:hypothetical protein
MGGATAVVTLAAAGVLGLVHLGPLGVMGAAGAAPVVALPAEVGIQAAEARDDVLDLADQRADAGGVTHALASSATDAATARAAQAAADAAKAAADQAARAAADAAAQAAADAAAQAAADVAARQAEADRVARDAQRQAVADAAKGDPRATARAMLAGFGWSDSQFSCLNSLWTKESGWNPSATNPSSGAYGIPQSLPASKMATAGADYRTNPATQIRWGLTYIKSSYGSPCSAWAHSQAVNWY